MRILIIGSGGREHALAWKLRQSPQKPTLYTAPGNAGTAEEGTNLPIAADDIDGLLAAVVEHSIDFVIPGPEAPLVKGIVDACKQKGIPCFGPSAFAAQLEGSKAFAKEIMRESGVPTADFKVFSDYERAAAYVMKRNCPLVIKADGLCAGKGVVVAKTSEEALKALHHMLVDKAFGKAGRQVIVEDTLVGEEVSFLALCDGENVIPLPSAQDHKAIFDNDMGPNTGGMGAYSPAPILPASRYDEMVTLAIRPILTTLKNKGQPFSGVLYAGLMMTAQGPMVLEYNVRFGDPECQPLLMRLKGDLLEVMLACAQGRLQEASLTYTDATALCVVMAAAGYPGSYVSGMTISGLETAEQTHPGKVKVFQAGTKLDNGVCVASGGRVLGITALGANLAEAKKNAYDAVAQVQMPSSFYRKDIGDKGIKASQSFAGGGN